MKAGIMVWNGRLRPAAYSETTGRARKGSVILQGESHAQHGYIRSKVRVVALNDRKDIAFPINDSEVSFISPIFFTRPGKSSGLPTLPEAFRRRVLVGTLPRRSRTFRYLSRKLFRHHRFQ
jgi:hypothetical protein